MQPSESNSSGREAGLSRLAISSDTWLKIIELLMPNEHIGLSLNNTNLRVDRFSSFEGTAHLYLIDNEGRPIYVRDSTVYRVNLARITNLSERVIELMTDPSTMLQQLGREHQGFTAGGVHLNPDTVRSMYKDAIRQIKEVFAGYEIR